jgi:urea transporter
MASHAWDDLACRNSLVGFIDVSLRGASQVFFQNNALSGLIMLAAIFWGGRASGNLSVAYGAVVGLVVASLTAVLLNSDRNALKQGLFGFNGVLVGAALPTFLAHQPLMWVYLVIGAAVSTVVTLAVANVVRTWGVPGSTAPFVFTTWLLLLAAYSLAKIPVASMVPPTLPGAKVAAELQLSGATLAGILAKNVSQVYLVENVVTGVFFVVAIAVSSLRSAAFALVGSVVSLLVAAVFGASGVAINAGLYGFSAVLTAIAVGAVFNAPSFRVTLYAIVATLFTVIVQAALNTAMSPLGIPTLTFPYVLTMWFFLLPKADLAPPSHHQAIPNGVLSRE